METNLLQTKLFIPAVRPSLVPRPRLINKLNSGLTGKIALISAPAGFGKTTLVSEWASQCQCPLAWLSLDEDDNDVARFLTYFVATLQTIDSNIGKGLSAAPQSTGMVKIERTLTPLLNEVAISDRNVVLVLDDYHVILSRQVDQALKFLINHMPANMHLVIATRIDPPLHLARLRGEGQLTELRTADLRFSYDEVATFLNQVMGLTLSAEDIAALEKRTEGWIVGLQLAALSLQESEDVNGFIQSFTGSHQHILDYLVEEVLSKQSPKTQSFLLQTSILERLYGPLCDAVCIDESDRGDGQSTLEQLAKSNLFIVPLDNERCWFRYHHLFADLLRERLRRYYPERVAILHQRAAEWFAANGFEADAVEQYLSAKEYDHAASLIEQIVSGTMLHGRLNTILRWLEVFPEGVLDDRPRLRFYQAWAISISGQPRIAEKILVDAKSTVEKLPDSPDNLFLRGEMAAMLTGVILYRNDSARIIREAEEALAYLPEENLIARARCYLHLGIACANSDDLQRAAKSHQRARYLALTAKNPFLAAAAIDLIADMQIFHQGRLREAVRNLEQNLELGRTAEGTFQTFTGGGHILLAEIYMEWSNLEEASRFLERGLNLLQKGGIGYTLTHAYCAKARLGLALREHDLAVEALKEAEQAAQDSPLMQFTYHNLAYQVKITLDLGDIESASHWASGDMCALPENPPAHLLEVHQISLAKVYFAQGDLRKTTETLNHIRIQAEASGRMAHVIEIYLLTALVLQEQGELDAAIESLKFSLSIAAPENYSHTFVEFGNPAAQLLLEAARQGVMPDYTARLLMAFGDLDFEDIRQAPQPIAEPLSPRELEVLRLIANGMSNRQICEQLSLSLDTVKGHNYRIYGKLGVHRRTEAIVRARELDLL